MLLIRKEAKQQGEGQVEARSRECRPWERINTLYLAIILNLLLIRNSD